MSNVIEDIWNGYVLLEGQKVAQRLGATAPSQDGWGTPPKPSNAQAQAAALANVPGEFTTKQVVIGAGVAALVVFAVVKLL